ncbi:MAG: RNA-guided endonuclease InsQ/TnpB family protein, partial [Candidatus Aenigmatarchaeota archaeon]
QRAISLTIPYDSDLVKTIEEFNNVCNFCLKRGFTLKTYNKLKLHKATYKRARRFSKLQSSLVQCARDQASDMLKREKLKNLPIKKQYSSIRYNQRTFSFNPKTRVLSLSSIAGRKKITLKIPAYFEKYPLEKVVALTLSLRDGLLNLRMIVELTTPEKLQVNSVLGIDRGIINPVVTSNNLFFNSRQIRTVKGRYRYLKSQLQKKGTPSAKRHLKRVSGKEKRFVANVNHLLSKKVVNMDYEAFALESLTVKKQKKLGKRFNKALGSWSYGQFQRFLEYKAETLGKTVVYIDPRYTSQCCSNCGDITKSNRNGNTYKCRKCRTELNADLNASRNIAELGKAFFSRLNVNEPIVAGLRNQVQLQAP